jgi:hypothetical protein
MPDDSVVQAAISSPIRGETEGAVEDAASTKSDGDDVCPVCFVVLHHKESRAAQIVAAPDGAEHAPALKVACCGGVFCLSCLRSSARYSTKCPLCRGAVHGCAGKQPGCVLCEAHVMRHLDHATAAQAEATRSLRRAHFPVGRLVSLCFVWTMSVSSMCIVAICHPPLWVYYFILLCNCVVCFGLITAFLTARMALAHRLDAHGYDV